ncbi:MAG: DUF1998 domain-containing protein [Acidobacteriota bacterium]
MQDERLARRLGVEYFRLPPPKPSKGQHGDYLPFVRFPLWHFCGRCRMMKESSWNEPFPPRCESPFPPSRFKAEPCAQLPEKKRWRMIPLRFIVACENGHVDDFPWSLWVHRKKGESLKSAQVCADPQLRFENTGKAGLIGLLVKCEACGEKRSMMGSAGPNSLKDLTCSGKRPWLGSEGSEICDAENPPIMLQRGATNLYFPKIASAILIPPFSNQLRRLIDDPHVWKSLSEGMKEGEMPDDGRLRFFANLQRIDLDGLRQAVSEKVKGTGLIDDIQDEEAFRYSEYRALLSTSSRMEEGFVTVMQLMGQYKPMVREYFQQVVLVEKLAETRALTGFSRIQPPPRREYDPEDRRQLALQPPPWLPAIRVYGEGIFLALNKQSIDRWLGEALRRRYDEILRQHQAIYVRLNREPRELPSMFFLLHTLAHVLIRRLSYDCGYGSSSLRERIYCSEDPNRLMHGILIYTAAGDSEGTMGGLVQQGKPEHLEQLLLGAVQDALWCSNDPLCIESHGQGIDSLNRAACHACALLSETSCEEGNRFLDRVALIGSASHPEVGFFEATGRVIMEGARG